MYLFSNVCIDRVEMCLETFKHRYYPTKVSRDRIFIPNAVQNVLSKVSSEKFLKHYELKVPEVSLTYADVHCLRNSIHIAGTSADT